MLADWTTTAAPFFTVELPASLGYALAYAVPGALIAGLDPVEAYHRYGKF